MILRTHSEALLPQILMLRSLKDLLKLHELLSRLSPPPSLVQLLLPLQVLLVSFYFFLEEFSVLVAFVVQSTG